MTSADKKHKTVARLSQVLLGLALVIAAGAKGFDVVRFGRMIEMLLGIYGERDTANWILICLMAAWLVIMVELVMGGMLITGCWTRLASRTALVMLSLFALIIVRQMMVAPETDCGCFGSLVKRTAGEALMEDVLLIGLAVLAGLEPFKGGRSAWIISTLLTLSGFAWTAFLYYNPPASSAVRIGSLWDLSDECNDQLAWIFDPECFHCQEQVRLLNLINQRDDLPDVTGFSDASIGRIDECVWDFEPEFAIKKISEHAYNRIFLPAGSLLMMVDRRITKIWRPTMLTGHFEEVINPAEMQ